MKATSLIISEIETKGFITEKEISLLKRRANSGDKEAAFFWPCVECTDEQTEKAYKWLKNLYVTPNGKERKNNPFGYREMNILDNWNGEKAEFKGFYDAGRYGFHNYLPVYDFGGMEYYVCGGIQIVG
jgi:hypothetical protein